MVAVTAERNVLARVRRAQEPGAVLDCKRAPFPEHGLCLAAVAVAIKGIR